MRERPYNGWHRTLYKAGVQKGRRHGDRARAGKVSRKSVQRAGIMGGKGAEAGRQEKRAGRSMPLT